MKSFLADRPYERDALLSLSDEVIASLRLSHVDKSKMCSACRHLADALDRSRGITLQQRWYFFEKTVWPAWAKGVDRPCTLWTWGARVLVPARIVVPSMEWQPVPLDALKLDELRSWRSDYHVRVRLGLGLRQRTCLREDADLVECFFAKGPATSGSEGADHKSDRLAYVPAYLQHDVGGTRQRREGGAGADAAREAPAPRWRSTRIPGWRRNGRRRARSWMCCSGRQRLEVVA
jgi:hypothetical protein